MEKQIALLRGINVGGHKKMPMAALRTLVEELGFTNVQSYIQSGNLVFESAVSASQCESILKAAILSHYGWDIPVFVITAEYIKAVISEYSLNSNWLEDSYFTMLSNTPTKKAIANFEAINYPGEHLSMGNNCVYFYCETGYGKAKTSSAILERKLGVSTTTRNYRTLMRLITMAG